MIVSSLIWLNLHDLYLLWFMKKIIAYVVVIFCIICQIFYLIFIALISLQKKKFGKLWKRKYSTEDARTKKYVVGRFLDYKMSDDKPIMEQVHGQK